MSKALEIKWSIKEGLAYLQIVHQEPRYFEDFKASNGIYIESMCEPEWTGTTLYCWGDEDDMDNKVVPVAIRRIFDINQAVDEFNRHFSDIP